MKYRLTDETNVISGVTVHRIQALKSFGDVTEGDLGGWVASEANLSQEGLCWVYGDAFVYGDAGVSGNAEVFGDAWVCGNAEVSVNACVFGYALVSGNAKVYGSARVSGNAQVYGDAGVSGYATVYGNACVSGSARVSGNAWVYGDAWVFENAQVYEDSETNTGLTSEPETFNTLDTKTQLEYEKHVLSKLLLDIGDLDCKFPEEMICRDIANCKMRIRLLEGV